MERGIRSIHKIKSTNVTMYLPSHRATHTWTHKDTVFAIAQITHILIESEFKRNEQEQKKTFYYYYLM